MKTRWMQITSMLLVSTLWACGSERESSSPSTETSVAAPSDSGTRRLQTLTSLEVSSTRVETPSLQLEEVFVEPPENSNEPENSESNPEASEDQTNVHAYLGVGAGGETEIGDVQILLRVETGYISELDFSKEDQEASSRLILLRTRTGLAIDPSRGNSDERVPYYEFEGQLVSWGTVFQTAGLDFGMHAVDVEASRLIELNRDRAVRVSLMGMSAGVRRQLGGSPKLQFLLQAAVDLIGIRAIRYRDALSTQATRAFDVTQVGLETGFEWIPSGVFRIRLTVGGDADLAFNSNGIFSEQTFFTELRARFRENIELFFRSRWWRSKDRIQDLAAQDAVQLLFGITYYFGSR